MNRYANVLCWILLFGAASLQLFGQTAGTGAIAGTVTDSSGAVIPGATVQAVNADTGQQRTVNTGADGSYRFALLPPGAYNLRFSANGFKTAEVPGLAVAVTETPVLDQKLELGTQSEQVTVAANAETIQTESAALGTVLGSSQVTALPLTTRNYTNILGLSAGVSGSVTNASGLGKAGMNMAVNGGGSGQNTMQLDGVAIGNFASGNTATDTFGTNGTTPVPNPDSLQEFKVQTSQYDAGYGRQAGANVNAVTKSGTNEFHGTAFEFFRNRELNANDFFANLSGNPRGVLNQNQYGGTVGGPIRKNKLFFFFSYQGTHQDNGIASQGYTALILPPIPPGDRSNTAAFQAAVGASFCPANHAGSTQFNTIRGGVQVACDGSNISAVAISLMQAKLPSGSYLFPGSGTGKFQNTSIIDPAVYTEQQGMSNIDYILSSKHSLSVRYFISNAPTLIAIGAAGRVPGFGSDQLYRNSTGLVKLTSVLTSSLVNEARVSIQRNIANAAATNNFSDHQFGITPVSPYQDYHLPGFTSIFNITGAYGVGSGGDGNDYTMAAETPRQIADQISWTHGKQTVRAGAEAEWIMWNWNFVGLGEGNINYSTFDDFLLGLPGCTPGNSACSAANPGLTNGTAFSNIASTNAADALPPAGNVHGLRASDYNAFVNDDIKLSQRLTLNFGLRWEYDGFIRDKYGILTNVWPSAILSVPVPGTTAATGTYAGFVVPSNYPQTLLPGMVRASTQTTLNAGPSHDNFAPRFGFAWQPIGGNRFVVRGGYGFFFDRVPGQNFEAGPNNAPPLAVPADQAGQANYYATNAVPFMATPGAFPARWVNFAATTSSDVSQQFYSENWITPLIQSYNIGVQYSFLRDWVLEVGYVGSHGIHLSEAQSAVSVNTSLLATAASPINGITTNTVTNAVLRVPYLGFAPSTLLNAGCTCSDSKFNSLQLTVRKQLSHGLIFQAAYTWARAMTDVTLTQNDDNFKQNYGLDPNYHPQRVVISYTYNLSVGNPKGFLGGLARGWSLSGVTTIQDGTPLTLTDSRGGTIYGQSSARAEIAAGFTYANIATPGSLTSRLGGAAGGCGYFTSPTTSGTLNGATCGSLSPFIAVPTAIAPDGTLTNGTGWGNTGIGLLLGPGQFNFDTALVKMTRTGGIHEDAALQFRAEFFNAFNHPQFSNPALVDSSAAFGQITTASVNPRVIQLALKYLF